LTNGHAGEHWYFGILGPVLPFLTQDLAITFTQVGILFAGRSMFSAFSSVGTGVAVDAMGGGKWGLISCVIGIAALYGGMSLADSFLVLLPLFWLSGLFSHLWHPPSMGLLGAEYSERKGFALGLHGTGANIGQTISPLIAGYLLLVMHWRGVFVWNMLPLLALAAILWIWLPPFHPAGVKEKNMGGTLRDIRKALFQNPVLGCVALISGAVTLSHHGLMAFLPLLLGTKHDIGPEWIGLCIGFYSAASIIPETAVGFLSDRMSRKRVLMIGTIGGGVAMLSIPALAPGPLILIPLAVIAVFLRSLRPVIFAYSLEIAPSQIGGSTIGLIFTTNQTFSALGPLAAGILSDIYGVNAAFWLFGSIALLTLPFFGQIPYSPTNQDIRPVPEPDSKSAPS
jgi:MFS family permease